jgi:hypothetical protein
VAPGPPGLEFHYFLVNEAELWALYTTLILKRLANTRQDAFLPAFRGYLPRIEDAVVTDARLSPTFLEIFRHLYYVEAAATYVYNVPRAHSEEILTAIDQLVVGESVPVRANFMSKDITLAKDNRLGPLKYY